MSITNSSLFQQVKVVYVRNLSPTITEEKLKEIFEPFGAVDRTKKIKDYAFVHYNDREHALKAIEEMHNKELDGINIEVSLAKPRDNSQPNRRQGGQSGYGSLNRGGGGGRGGRGRGGRGGERGGGRGGYDHGHDSYYDGGYGGGYGGGDYGGYGSGDYYDSYYGGGGGGGYDDYYSGGRGGRGGYGRGGGGGGRGGPRGGPRGGRGGRGGGDGYGRGRGRGGRGDFGGDRGRGGLPPSKRKYGADNPGGVVGYPEPKKRYNPEDQYWGSQPIAQAPQYNSGYGDVGGGQEWYQDSYGQQWN